MINIRPQTLGTPYETIPDLQGIVYEVTQGEPLTTTHINLLDGNKAPAGFLVINKSGFVDVYINIVNSETFEIIRSADISCKIMIF